MILFLSSCALNASLVKLTWDFFASVILSVIVSSWFEEIAKIVAWAVMMHFGPNLLEIALLFAILSANFVSSVIPSDSPLNAEGNEE